MFVLSKVLWFVANPAVVLLFALVAGAALLWSRRWRQLGRWIVTATAAVSLALAVVPVGPYLMATLEDRFPPPASLPDRVDGIVVLSGFVSMATSIDRGTVELNALADRLTAFIALARRFPKARLVFTGGSGLAFGDRPSEASFARRLLVDLGQPVDRIAFEDRSRNTAENASLTRALADPGPGETWLLVTSAFHMPRAVACFRKVGWDVVPYPVDFQTGGRDTLDFELAPLNNMEALMYAIHEVAGLIAYRLLGYTEEIWPAPKA